MPFEDAVRLVADMATGRQPKHGAWISTDGPVPADGQITIGTILRAPAGELVFVDPFPPGAVEAWKGYSFSLYGALTSQGSGLGISQWRIYDTASGATLSTVGILREQVRYGTSNLYVEALALPINGGNFQLRAAILGWDLPHGDDDVVRARHAVRLLGLLAEIEKARRSGPVAMSNDEAFEQAVSFGLEWLADNPGAMPGDFGRKQFTAKRCTGPDATERWMKEKHFGIRQVQRALGRRIRRPS